MKPRISMITLGVEDLQRAKQFYQQGLGLPLFDFASDEVAFFNLNGSWLGLYGWDALAADAKVSAESGGFRGFSLAHNMNSIEQVDQLLEQAVAAGATLTKPAQNTDWGG
ncbi:MAG: VOC family protein, partial [Gammaproteobacteria bacterium]|nr:VOC family protein [Gammaproteobacteria bacterium]